MPTQYMCYTFQIWWEMKLRFTFDDVAFEDLQRNTSLSVQSVMYKCEWRLFKKYVFIFSSNLLSSRHILQITLNINLFLNAICLYEFGYTQMARQNTGDLFMKVNG